MEYSKETISLSSTYMYIPTCYSPVCHGYPLLSTIRLACVKSAVSVRSEPGLNSQKNLRLFFSLIQNYIFTKNKVNKEILKFIFFYKKSRINRDNLRHPNSKSSCPFHLFINDEETISNSKNNTNIKKNKMQEVF
jgi:hypothetical protein